MTEPRDKLGHTPEDYRQEAAKYRQEAEHCSLRDNYPAITLYEERAQGCEYAAWELEAAQ